jgi:Mg2+/Co2+ transporter CorC
MPAYRLGPKKPLLALAKDAANRDFFDALITMKEMIMKTIQITVTDTLHQRAKELALQNHTTLKSFVLDAIEAHVVRMEAVTPESPAKKGAVR